MASVKKVSQEFFKHQKPSELNNKQLRLRKEMKNHCRFACKCQCDNINKKKGTLKAIIYGYGFPCIFFFLFLIYAFYFLFLFDDWVRYLVGNQLMVNLSETEITMQTTTKNRLELSPSN